MASQQRTYRPFVYWAQDKERIYLKVDIKGAKDVNANVSNDGTLIDFTAYGSASSAESSDVLSQYKFQLPLYNAVQNQLEWLRICESRVEIRLLKRELGFWGNGLLSEEGQRQGHKWLKFDFERWQDDPDESGIEPDDEQQQLLSERRHNPYLEDMLRELEREKQTGSASMMSEEEFERYISLMYTAYLFIYNIAMFCAFFYILCSLLLDYVSTPKSEFVANFWTSHFSSLLFCTALQYMEVLHSLTGLIKSGYKASLIQVSGRLFALFVINGCPPCKIWSPVFTLVLIYMFSEQFRYPYYALNTLGITLRPVTWLRYSMWMLLIPLGLLLEGLVLIRSIPYYYDSGSYSLRLPNALNFSFNFGIFLAFFTLLCLPCIGYTLLRHMYKQRMAKMAELGRTVPKKKLK